MRGSQWPAGDVTGPGAGPGSVCDHLMGHSGKLVCTLLLWPERAVRYRVSPRRHCGGRAEGRGLGLSQSQGTLRSRPWLPRGVVSTAMAAWPCPGTWLLSRQCPPRKEFPRHPCSWQCPQVLLTHPSVCPPSTPETYFLLSSSGCCLGIKLFVYCKYIDPNPKFFLTPLTAGFTPHTKDNTG